MIKPEIKSVIAHLKKIGKVEVFEKKRDHFGIVAQNALGISHKDLKVIAKELGRNDDLALELYDSGYHEGKILCSKMISPKVLTEEMIEKWVSDFDSWEMTDSFCMGPISKTSFAYDKAFEWSEREAEFEKRAGFVLMACHGFNRKKDSNEAFLNFFEPILKHADDERNFVKKAVNWALRSIGKRNQDLRKEAIKIAYQLLENKHPSKNWIAKDALRELEKEGVKMQDYPRDIYRPKAT